MLARRAAPSAVPRVVAIGAAMILAGCVGIQPAGSAASLPEATPEPSASVATDAPSSSPDPESTPAPTPTPDPAVMDLVATTCPGGVVLEWTPSTHPNFHHYTALRSLEEDIAPDYPPIAPAVDWGETYATDPFVTSAVDGSILPSDFTWHYRVMAYDILNDPVSASPVRVASIERVDSLGEPDVTDAGGARTRISWQALDPDAPTGCFSAYRVLFGVGWPSTVLTEISDRSATQIETDALHSGTTYQLRVDAIRVTPLGSLVVGRSRTMLYTVP
jgi:hypothetical protein